MNTNSNPENSQDNEDLYEDPVEETLEDIQDKAKIKLEAQNAENEEITKPKTEVKIKQKKIK